jgi:hypothetical protein
MEPNRARTVVSAKPAEAPKRRSRVLDDPGIFIGVKDDNNGRLYETAFEIMNPFKFPTESTDEVSKLNPETDFVFKTVSLDQRDALEDEPVTEAEFKKIDPPIRKLPL